MAKWYGSVGYVTTVETKPSVWVEEAVERKYYGDVIRDTRRLDSASRVNDDVTVSSRISIVADPYAMENFHAIRYAELMGAYWKVTSVEVQYPRLILELGGVHNGPKA